MHTQKELAESMKRIERGVLELRSNSEQVGSALDKLDALIKKNTDQKDGVKNEESKPPSPRPTL